MGGRGSVPESPDERLEDAIVCNVCCEPGDCNDDDAARSPMRDVGHHDGRSCGSGRGGDDTPTSNTNCSTNHMGVSRSELTSSGCDSGGSDRPPAVAYTAEAETSSAHNNACTPDARSRRPGVVTIDCGTHAAPEVVLIEPSTSYQKSSSGLPPDEEQSPRYEPTTPCDSSSSSDCDLPEPPLGNTDMKATVSCRSPRVPLWTPRRSSTDVSRIDRHSVAPGPFAQRMSGTEIARPANKTGVASEVHFMYRVSSTVVRPANKTGVASAVVFPSSAL